MKHTQPEFQNDLKQGYIRCCISDNSVKATPEEVEAVQVFAKRLHADFSYPKADIQVHPQWRVRKAPSDEEKSYPVDIAVFKSDAHTEENIYIIVECKKKTRKDGTAQLKLYLDMSSAEIGVWFNGNEHEYLRKIHHKNGTRTYQTLPNLPRYTQRIEDIGLYKRKDLQRASNLRAVFKDLRNHLAGMTTGMARDEALAQEIINVLFCKIYDEQETLPNETVTFRAGVGEDHVIIKERIDSLFEKVKNIAYEDVFLKSDVINLDSKSLTYVVGELQTYCVMDADRDAIGDAFEVFIGPALRGAEGQFFTPRNVVKLIMNMIDPGIDDKIIDPACGSGGFLITALEHVWNNVKQEGHERNWTQAQITRKEIKVATDNFRGLDKDAFLSKVCKAYMALIGDGRGGVFCANSLEVPSEWPRQAQDKIHLGSFDVVLTNPPFGKNIVVKGTKLLSQYEFGYKWKKDKDKNCWHKTQTLHEEQPPQILFLERCLQLLKPNGRMGIVLPESILGNPSYEHVVNYITTRTRIRALVTMPEALFKTSGKGGTHTKVAVLIIEKALPKADYEIFMSEAKWCGHDSRGNPTFRKNSLTGERDLLDDIPIIAELYNKFLNRKPFQSNHLGFVIKKSQIQNRILVPKYYNPEIDAELVRLKSTHDLVPIAQLVSAGTISLATGVEVGKMAYGTGTIPFIRTSDLSNWEIKADFKHGVSEELYEMYKSKVDIMAGDILLVRDGTYLIGTSAIVTESDLPMLFQSHLFRIRVLLPSKIDPWLLFACLNMPIVKKQIRAKQFTQDIIDTLGKRISELIIPVPKDAKFASSIAGEVQNLIRSRNILRNRSKQITLELEGISEDVASQILEAEEVI